MSNPLADLCQRIAERCALEEIQALYFQLGIDWDELPGQTKSAKARALLFHLGRRERLADLLAALHQTRPDAFDPPDIIDLDALSSALRQAQRDASDAALPAWEKDTEPAWQHPPPCQLPPRAEHFVSREEQLQWLTEVLRPDQVVTLCGPGGIGKTALAAEALHRLPTDRFPDGTVFYSFYGRSDVALAFEHIVKSFDKDALDFSPDVARRILAGKKALLILDGAEEANVPSINSRQSLGAVLAVRGECGVLITTRSRRQASANTLYMKPLEQAPAVALLQAWGKDRANDTEAAQAICDQVGGLPLAVRLVGRYLNEAEETADEYLEWLSEMPIQALSLGKSREESIYVFLKRSLAQVSEGAQQALGVVGRLALAPFAAETVAAALDLAVIEARKLLAELVNYGLLLRPAPAKYYEVSHALVYTYGRRRLAVSDKTLERLLAYYRRLAMPPKKIRVGIPYWDGLRNYAAIESLEPEWPHLKQLILKALQCGYEREALGLYLPVVHLLNAWGAWEDRLQMGRDMCEVANRLEDPSEAWLWIDALGWIYREYRDFQQGMAALDRGRQVADRFKLKEALMQADAYEARLHLAKGDFKAARQKMEDALGQKMEDALNQTNWELVFEREDLLRKIIWGRVFGAAAALEHAEKRFLQAKEWIKLELTTRESVGEGLGPILARLGHLSIRLGEITSAKEYLKQALSTAGPKDRALINYSLGLVAEKEKDFQETRRLGELALKQYSWLGMQGGVQNSQALLARLSKKEDLSFATYRQTVNDKIHEKVEGLTARPAGRYRAPPISMEAAQIEPMEHPGYTILAEPYPVQPLCRENLKQIQQALIGKVAGFAPVPVDTLHMTVADLVSIERFTRLLGQPGWESAFAERIETLLSKWSRSANKGIINGTVRGLGLFPSTLIAVVDFDDRDEYEQIIELRNILYTDPTLASCGVKRRFPFLGHITLGYLESTPVSKLDALLTEMRAKENFGSKLQIEGVRLYYFPHMSKYEPRGAYHSIA